MQYKDYYRVLGVERGADSDTVKKAYRRLARKYHPDVSTEPDAEARFKEIGEAYEVLRDPKKRAAYDRLGTGWRQGEEFTPPPDWGSAFEFDLGDGAHFEFSDFFDQLFGHRAARGASRARRSRPAADEHFEITITLEEAMRGAERTITLSRPGARAGAGRAPRTLRVQIPRGVVPGQQIRLSGQGHGGGRGDLLLTVKLAPHPVYRVEGRDLHMTLPIAPWEAALGANVEASTPGGRVDLKIPPGSQSGRKLRLKGRGLGASGPGDLYVTLHIFTPPADSEEAKAFYRRMREALPFDPRQRS
ncbi:MAG: DnaJ C-terminal domain-containing protein [Gammaproteobacteria bacterium]|nr:DnaJ C-terminal domain-containing protein [Gammaproteobacteria bacterium]